MRKCSETPRRGCLPVPKNSNSSKNLYSTFDWPLPWAKMMPFSSHRPVNTTVRSTERTNTMIALMTSVKSSTLSVELSINRLTNHRTLPSSHRRIRDNAKNCYGEAFKAFAEDRSIEREGLPQVQQKSRYWKSADLWAGEGLSKVFKRSCASLVVWRRKPTDANNTVFPDLIGSSVLFLASQKKISFVYC